MRTLLRITLFLIATCSHGAASERMLTQTFQPLDGLGSNEIQIVSVTCLDGYALSGLSTAIGLITVKNIPPTNSSGPVEDINIASMFGIKLSYDEDPSMRGVVTIDCTRLHNVETLSYTELQAVRATLECLRRVAEKSLDNMTIKSALNATGQEEVGKIIAEFIKHPKDKEFPWND